MRSLKSLLEFFQLFFKREFCESKVSGRQYICACPCCKMHGVFLLKEKQNKNQNPKEHVKMSDRKSKEKKGGHGPRVFGYCRVSSADQNEARQLDAMASQGVPKSNIFVDKQSGKDFERPSWRRLTKTLRPGDVLHVQSIDRLGRDYEEILRWWQKLTVDMGVGLVVLDIPILDTLRPKDLLEKLISHIALPLFGYVA